MVKCPFAAKGCNYPEGDCPGHCLVDNGGLRQHQPKALRLAKILEDHYFYVDTNEAAAELRRLHAENEKLRAENSKLQKWIVGEAQVAGTLDRKLRKARKQRDELLAALRRIADTSANQSGTGAPWVHWVDQARAAIAKAGGAAWAHFPQPLKSGGA